MGFFLTDAIKSALTPPGTNEARRDSGRKGYPQKLAGELLAGYEPVLKDNLSLIQGAQPAIKSAFENILKLTNPLHTDAKVAATRQKLLSDARTEAEMLKAKYAGTGGIGLEQGLEIGAVNDANRSANDLQRYYASPEGIAEISNLVIQLTKMFPGADILAMLNAIIQGREAPKVGSDPLTSIGNVASLFVGGGGGGGGGGGRSTEATRRALAGEN